MTAEDPLETLRLTHSQWSSRYVDQIEPEDYPGLLAVMAAAIAAWEKERAGFEAMMPHANTIKELAALRAEVLKIAEEMGAHPSFEGSLSKRWAARLRKACE